MFSNYTAVHGICTQKHSEDNTPGHTYDYCKIDASIPHTDFVFICYLKKINATCQGTWTLKQEKDQQEQ